MDECDEQNLKFILCQSIFEFYKTGLFCDLQLVSSDNVPHYCHGLILAAISPLVASLHNGSLEEDVTIFLPDYSSDDIKKCIDSLYLAFAGGTSVDLSKFQLSKDLGKGTLLWMLSTMSLC